VKGIVLIGGKSPDYKLVKHEIETADIIIAADSGLEYAVNNKIHVDYIVGDMDSIENKKLLDKFPSDIIEVYPEEKDETDTEIGIRALQQLGADQITIIGGGGGRLDHLIGILTLFERKNPPHKWVNHSYQVIAIFDTLEADVEEGEIISFFPLGCNPCTMKSTGLKWNLDGLTWRRGDMGISNVAVGKKVFVEMKTGRVIMVRKMGKEYGSE
jgi:thiamine pyrophosphokinase